MKILILSIALLGARSEAAPIEARIANRGPVLWVPATAMLVPISPSNIQNLYTPGDRPEIESTPLVRAAVINRVTLALDRLRSINPETAHIAIRSGDAVAVLPKTVDGKNSGILIDLTNVVRERTHPIAVHVAEDVNRNLAAGKIGMAYQVIQHFFDQTK